MLEPLHLTAQSPGKEAEYIGVADRLLAAAYAQIPGLLLRYVPHHARQDHFEKVPDHSGVLGPDQIQ